MIISKTPFRIPLTGGGTDLDFYYKKRGGQLYSLAINQHVYVLIHRREIDKNYLIQTTKTEFSEKINNINHDLISPLIPLKIIFAFYSQLYSKKEVFLILKKSYTYQLFRLYQQTLDLGHRAL